MSIKKTIILITLLIFSTINLNAENFTKVASSKPVLVQSGKEKEWCPICGMSIKMFYKTSHTSKLFNHNNKDRQYCSVRCLVVDMKEYTIDLKSIKVVDASSQQLISAINAFYVVESKVKGTMSKVSKLAFATKNDANEFIKKYGGRVVSFKEVLKMAEASLKSDISMVTKKKEKKIYPMGKKIFTKMCKQDIKLTDYLEINELKSDIKNKKLCKPLKEKQLQALSLYLWEVKRFERLDKILDKIDVPKDAKCPICGMFVYKYPRWAVKLTHNKKDLYFDGVKDMFKYYFKYKNIKDKIIVTDYYSQKAIDARTAFYVIGSDIYGPMGDELIPFQNENDAKTFYMDHRAKKIIKFKDVKKEEVYKLDE